MTFPAKYVEVDCPSCHQRVRLALVFSDIEVEEGMASFAVGVNEAALDKHRCGLEEHQCR